MGRRSDHTRDELKELMINAAIEIVASEGRSALSTRKVTKQIGYTVGTMYLVFDDLEDLIVHVNDRTMDTLYSSMLDSIIPGNPLDSIKKMALAYSGYAVEKEALWGLCMEHRLSSDKPFPDWYVQKGLRLLALVEEQLNQYVADETLCYKGARSIWSSVHGACVLHLGNRVATQGKIALDQLVVTNIDMIVTGMMNQPEAQKLKMTA